ncbi:MAG: four helix bundle protein [Planctomycetota bacterium]
MPMTNNQDDRLFDLEDRTFEFARRVRAFVKKLPDTVANREDIPQLLRASGSVGANYREANDALGKKDFAMRIRISRKESKESRYWLRLVDTGEDEAPAAERDELVGEATELVKIFSSILQKCK